MLFQPIIVSVFAVTFTFQLTFGNEFAVVAFGNGELIANFQAKLAAAYPEAVLAINEPIM